MNTFYIIRHGQTKDNLRHIIQGHGDSELTEAGVSSLLERAKKLKEIKFDEVFCSPLLRAKQSLLIMSPYLLLPATPNYSDDLKEIDFGLYTKQPLSQLKDKILYHKANPSIPYPKGESGEQLIHRSCQFIDTINQQNNDGTFLIVTHFGVLESIVTYYADEKFEDICIHKDDIARLIFYSNNEVALTWV